VIAAAVMFRTPHRTSTYQTLIGLLSVTGMRVGEAIRLNRDDIDFEHGLLLVSNTKFGKSRELPLHPSTVDALLGYLHRSDRPRSAQPTTAVFISGAGTRLLYCNVQNTFAELVCRAGLEARSAPCRPQLHDLRHSFAVATMLDAYRSGADVQAQLGLLSTYLRHINPSSTYWYLQAAPELLGLAGQRLESHLEKGLAMTLLAPTLQAFFTDRLISQRQASPHTIPAYRDTLRLLLTFASDRIGKEPSRLDVDDLNAPLIGAFLDHLEHERHNPIRTRNTRLAAIRSLFRYPALRHPEHAAVIERVLAIGLKRFDRNLVCFLTEPELDALLAAPDRSTPTGRRDHALAPPRRPGPDYGPPN
jgi:integrase